MTDTETETATSPVTNTAAADAKSPGLTTKHREAGKREALRQCARELRAVLRDYDETTYKKMCQDLCLDWFEQGNEQP